MLLNAGRPECTVAHETNWGTNNAVLGALIAEVTSGRGPGVALWLLCLGMGPTVLGGGELSLRLPVVGTGELRVLTPSMLEVTWINTKSPDPARVETCDFVADDGSLHLPATNAFTVSSSRGAHGIRAIGFKRRVCYAPLKSRDLRIGNYVYLELDDELRPHETVEVRATSPSIWPTNLCFAAAMESDRWSPVIHVNQVGYQPTLPKQAMIGWFLGSLGELKPPTSVFQLVDMRTGREVFTGQLHPRPDHGFTFRTYTEVVEADFSEFRTPGEYRLRVPGLGMSFPFVIDEGTAGAFARTYALGLYHQRCGTALGLPYTRFMHDACHLAAANVPTAKDQTLQRFLAELASESPKDSRRTAPPLKDIDASLYPFVNQGEVDVSGGHHDAGDYSKYTINSAALIHHLVFAADALAGVGELDNLGLPESGDGKSDVLEEAKWEADFLVKMQDADGGFYFLVYPRDRKYESDVTPDKGDPQVVWPKNTAGTAAAVAALAQCASSPLFKKQFPEEAQRYLAKAKLGWAFLQRAIEAHGKDGAYQKITHYGDQFMHDDELAWAACEMFLATGDAGAHQQLIQWLSPGDPATRKWTWWRLYEAYGCAIRSYAFAGVTRRVERQALDQRLLKSCEDEIVAAGQEQLHRAEDSAYGTSLPAETKRSRSAGWYFSLDQAFDLVVACQLDYPLMNDPRPKFRAAVMSNLAYEAGCNPVNLCYVTGLGWKRQREIVHQYAQNNRRLLPPSGIPLGSVQGGFGWMDRYKRELGALSYPADGAPESPYPFYDRWGDSFNLQTEFVIVDQARCLACTAWLMAQTPLRSQQWKAAPARIEGIGSNLAVGTAARASLRVEGMDPGLARVVWEVSNEEPAFGSQISFTPQVAGAAWIEAEAQWLDGRRAFGSKELRFEATR